MLFILSACREAEEQLNFLAQNVFSIPVQELTATGESHRARTIQYTFAVQGARIKVCKTMSLHTVGVSESKVKAA